MGGDKAPPTLLERLSRRGLRAMPWLTAGVIAALPVYLAYRTYRGERAAFISGAKQRPPDPATLGVPGLRAVVGRVGGSADAILRELGITSDDVTLVTVRRE